MTRRPTRKRSDRPEVRLERCDIAECEGHCCHDGAYLEPADEARIFAALAAYPEFFAGLPVEPIIEGVWNQQPSGRKTATRPWTYRRELPAHFTATRCVFADDIGYCRLESAARANGLHPWTFKPEVCFLFPLHHDDPESGPVPPGKDPHDLGSDYPGFSTFVGCGRHRPDGRPWREVLKEELEALETPIDLYFEAWRESQSP